MTFPEKNGTDLPIDCNNPDHQMFLAGVHSIKQTEFAAWIQNFNPNLIVGQAITAEELGNMYIDLDCKGWAISFTIPDNGGLPDSNEDIDIRPSALLTTMYSIPLFKGIMRLFAPNVFYFFKAIKPDGQLDIIFKADKGGQPVYFGDLSGLP